MRYLFRVYARTRERERERVGTKELKGLRVTNDCYVEFFKSVFICTAKNGALLLKCFSVIIF